MLSAPASLFGGESGWNEEDWTASDDRVRGGKSQSYLTANGKYATFYGNLDIETLGGAGFASQRTATEQRHWDLSAYDGIELTCDARGSDRKRYTFILKDELPPPGPFDTREKSTVSWEFDFQLEPGQLTNGSHLVTVEIPWTKLRATYRGREVDVPRPLRLHHVRRFSVMMRSFFGTQSGDFKLRIHEVRCIQQGDHKSALDDASSCGGDDEKEQRKAIDNDKVVSRNRSSWWAWLASCVQR